MVLKCCCEDRVICLALEGHLYVQRCHLPPIVAAVRAPIPDMQLVAHTLGAQDVTQLLVVVQERVFIANRHDDVHAAQVRQLPIAIQVGQKMAGRVEIDVFVVVAAQQVVKGLDAQGQVIAA